jgi:hypothetical protein
LDGEIAATPDDAEAVLERVHELYNLAEEALNREIERDQGEQAIGRRDEEPRPANDNRSKDPGKPPERQQAGPSNGHDSRPRNDEAATNKQCQYLLSIAKRQRLSTQALEAKIEQLIGRRCGVYQLSKREAGTVIDALTNGGSCDGRANDRR